MEKLYRRFFIRHVISLLVPMLVPLLILGMLSSVFIHQFIRKQVVENHVSSLIQMKENLDLVFAELDSLNMNIVASAMEFLNLRDIMEKDLHSPEERQQLAALKNFIDSPPIARTYIDSIYVYIDNTKGHFITSTTGGLVSFTDYYDTAWFSPILAGSGDHQPEVWTVSRTILKPGLFNRLEPVNLITMYRQIMLADGSYGLIVLNVNRDYIDKLMQNLANLEGQSFFIRGSGGEFLFHSTASLQEAEEQLLRAEDEALVFQQITSDKYGWTLMSITPKASLYKLPNQLTALTAALVAVSFAIGLAVAVKLARKNTRDVRTIIKFLEAAERNEPLPPMTAKGTSLYTYIIQSIIQNFVRHNYLRVQLSERKYKSQALEYSALQSQLNPHFLYNTLETINWKAASLTGGYNEVNHMIEDLAEILRYSLDTEVKMVTLQEELKYTKHYVDILRKRYRDIFTVRWQIDESLLNYRIAKLIFQPMIENSVYHGIKEKGTPCGIKIRVLRRGRWMVVTIADSGIGMLPEKLASIRKQLENDAEPPARHIGLFNTHRRLRLIFGDDYSITVRSKFGWGTAITMHLPIH